MSYCQKCGSYIPVDETVCPACGYDSNMESSAPRNSYSGQGQSGGQGQATASQGQYTQDSSQGAASQAQYAENKGQYTAQDRSRRQYEEPWNRPEGWEPWSEGTRARKGGRKHKYDASYQDEQGSRRQAFTVPGDISDNRYLCILCYLGPLFLIPYLLRKDSPYARFHANQGLLLLLLEILLPIAANFVPFFSWAVGLAGGIFTLVCFFKGINSTINGRLDKLPLIGDINLINQ